MLATVSHAHRVDGCFGVVRSGTALLFRASAPRVTHERTARRTQHEDLAAEGATALPDKEVVSILDLNADLDLAIDAAAPIDLAVAANANVAAPIDAAVAANVLSSAPPPRRSPTRASCSTRARRRRDRRRRPGQRPSTRAHRRPRTGCGHAAAAHRPGDLDRAGRAVRRTLPDGRRHCPTDASTDLPTRGVGACSTATCSTSTSTSTRDTDVAAPIDGAVAANANVAAPIDAAVAANIGSIDCEPSPSPSRTRSSTRPRRVPPTATADQDSDDHPARSRYADRRGRPARPPRPGRVAARRARRRASSCSARSPVPATGSRPALARRADGQTVQLTPLLYALLEASTAARPRPRSRRCGGAPRPGRSRADNVAHLLDEKLRPLGPAARDADGTEPELSAANPLLGPAVQGRRHRPRADPPAHRAVRRAVPPGRRRRRCWPPSSSSAGGCCSTRAWPRRPTRRSHEPGLLLLVFALTVAVRRLPRVRPRRRRRAAAAPRPGVWAPGSTWSGRRSTPTSPTPTGSAAGAGCAPTSAGSTSTPIVAVAIVGRVVGRPAATRCCSSSPPRSCRCCASCCRSSASTATTSWPT